MDGWIDGVRSHNGFRIIFFCCCRECKKGIMELVDLIVITKADGDLLLAARRIQTEYLSALRMIHRALNHPWKPRVSTL